MQMSKEDDPEPLVVQPGSVELVISDSSVADAEAAEDVRELWRRETAAQDATKPPPTVEPVGSSDAEVTKERWKAKWNADAQSAPISGASHNPLVALEPLNYFASGEPQPFQCTVRCGEFSDQEFRSRQVRILPCFVNGPFLVDKPCTVPDLCTATKGGQWRCCSSVGNFTVLLERLVPRHRLQSGVAADATATGHQGGGGSGVNGSTAVPTDEESGTDEDDGDQQEERGAAEKEDDDDDEEEGQRRSQPPLSPRRELWLVMGPYWPFCLAMTTSLSVLIPLAIAVFFWKVLPGFVVGAELAGCCITLLALSSVACRDPGLVPHFAEEPAESKRANPKERPSKKWIFNDLTQSWRPRGAVYDRDVNAVVRGFDHVCPFTGTAIGENNLKCFYAFVVSVQFLIYMSIGIGAYGFYVTASEGYSAPTED